MTIVCSGHRYIYKGVIIEVSGIGGPCVLKQDGAPYERTPTAMKKTLDEWNDLPEEEQEKYRAGGGCQVIG